MKTIATALLCLTAFLIRAQEPTTPAGHIELFNGRDFSGLSFYMHSNAAPENTWSVSNGLIHCTGKPAGYLRTERTYRDFSATVEWRFTKPGNTGLCVFMQDRATNASPRQVWPHCVECQGMHDHMGDFWLQGGATCAEPFTLGKNGIKMLQPSAESPVGEWTTFQTICRSNTVEIIVNGKSMNKLTGADVSAGYIGLQSEGAEMEVRKFFLEPLPIP